MLQIIIVIIIIIPIYKDGIVGGVCKVVQRPSLWGFRFLFREGCSVRLSLFWDFVYLNQLVSKEIQSTEKEKENVKAHTH